MADLKSEAAQAVVSYPVKGWVRAYFSTRSYSWMVDNNICESFNAWIYDLRFLPIIRMVDGIRLKMMSKWAESEKNASKWRGQFSPKCLLLFEVNKRLSVGCAIFFNGDDGYEVCEGDDRHTVWVHKKECTCRVWQLTGIPCQHAICALHHANIDPQTQISRFYHRDTYIDSYRTKFQPVRGKRFWGIHRFEPMDPPPLCTMPGRPAKKRKRTEEGERREKAGIAKQRGSQQQVGENVDNMSNIPQSPPKKLSRKGCTPKCSVCHKEGHNRARCPDVPRTSEASSSQQSQSSQRPRGGRAFYRQQSGTVSTPGSTSRLVLNEGSGEHYMNKHADIETRFPIPNERNMRITRSMSSRSSNSGTRLIQVQADSPSGPTPSSDLPVTPPGLTWQGHRAMTTSQLLAHRDRSLISPTSRMKLSSMRGR